MHDTECAPYGTEIKYTTAIKKIISFRYSVYNFNLSSVQWRKKLNLIREYFN